MEYGAVDLRKGNASKEVCNVQLQKIFLSNMWLRVPTDGRALSICRSILRNWKLRQNFVGDFSLVKTKLSAGHRKLPGFAIVFLEL